MLLLHHALLIRECRRGLGLLVVDDRVQRIEDLLLGESFDLNGSTSGELARAVVGGRGGNRSRYADRGL
jgi:hypothetical protein